MKLCLKKNRKQKYLNFEGRKIGEAMSAFLSPTPKQLRTLCHPLNKPDIRADIVPGTIRYKCQTRETKMFARTELYSRKKKTFSFGSKFHRLDMPFNDFLS